MPMTCHATRLTTTLPCSRGASCLRTHPPVSTAIHCLLPKQLCNCLLRPPHGCFTAAAQVDPAAGVAARADLHGGPVMAPGEAAAHLNPSLGEHCTAQALTAKPGKPPSLARVQTRPPPVSLTARVPIPPAAARGPAPQARTRPVPAALAALRGRRTTRGT
jgi:hypothetical protein